KGFSALPYHAAPEEDEERDRCGEHYEGWAVSEAGDHKPAEGEEQEFGEAERNIEDSDLGGHVFAPVHLVHKDVFGDDVAASCSEGEEQEERQDIAPCEGEEGERRDRCEG